MEEESSEKDLHVNGSVDMVDGSTQRHICVDADEKGHEEDKVLESAHTKDEVVGGDDKMQSTSSGKGNVDGNRQTVENSSKKDSLASGVGNNMEPYVGMEFKNEEAARSFYNAYARHVGFSIRSSSTQRARGGKCIGRHFVCSKEGFRQKKRASNETQGKRFRPVTREGCKASLHVKREKNGKWIVKKFVKDHSHALADPTEAQYLRSHRNVTRTMQSLIDTCMSSGLHVNLLSSYLRDKAGGAGNFGASEQDQKNHIHDLRKRILGKGDVQSILDCFKHMQTENPAFFYAMQVNGEGHVSNFFWADARSRMTYGYFGDVVTLDMISNTSKCELPVAVFTGLNHHRQVVFVGCGLLLDETESSFVWLFSTWLEAMSGQHPVSLITNSHPAICAAVAKIFPGTRHRLSMHYILREMPDKLSHVYEMHLNFENEFYKCLHMTETIVEFEECWQFLVDRYGLRENHWIQSIYEMRHQWVPAYFRNSFFAEMAGSQWNESVQAIFHECINSDTTFLEFIKQQGRAMEGQYRKEMHADFETSQSPQILKTSWPLEKQAAELYTRTIFGRFQEELLDSFGYMTDELENDGISVIYRVVKFGEEKRACTVKMDISTMRVSCSCQMFEFSGILCRHVLIVFVQRSIIILPPQYILKRFTRSARSGAAADECHTDSRGDFQESTSLRYNNLFRRVVKCAEDGGASADTHQMVLQALEKACSEIARIKENAAIERSRSARQENNSEIEVDNLMNQLTSHDTRQAKPQRKLRHCNICKANNHDKRNCPALRATSAIGCLIPPVDEEVQNDQGFHWLSGEELGLSIGIPMFPSGSR
ncbi:protein FAR1-RELATED SEQUENCE 5-like [Nymphaea colorata]|nr:protein FAR1-RELATED SEQUENCE 5-like [Nymphaea colorata]XP_031504284.1 protein FAR1-RELATED SEQUENCE 5-like [Nymphaea colorata]XP_031504285.1 protein FAR1-RELATED SEQUENCE 5-like [Nymphaea colorata]XP_031504286.1 protein FAR1-RELATED SEQUENCE 5-like [Nymphaea colorata]